MMVSMSDGTDIFQAYSDHLRRKAGSIVRAFAIVGMVGGAALGAMPGLLSHSLISPGVGYLAILLGALAGGIAGRSIGEKRAVGLRFQAQLVLHQGVSERQPVVPVVPPAAPVVAQVPVAFVPVASAPVAPAPVAPALVAPAPVAPAPLVAAPPVIAPVPPPAPPAPAPVEAAPPPPEPVAPALQPVPPAPVLAPEAPPLIAPAPPPAPPAPPAVAPEPPAAASVPAPPPVALPVPASPPPLTLESQG
jgi:hypothetical protein